MMLNCPICNAYLNRISGWDLCPTKCNYYNLYKISHYRHYDPYTEVNFNSFTYREVFEPDRNIVDLYNKNGIFIKSINIIKLNIDSKLEEKIKKILLFI